MRVAGATLLETFAHLGPVFAGVIGAAAVYLLTRREQWQRDSFESLVPAPETTEVR